jgi:hypothetical protein
LYWGDIPVHHTVIKYGDDFWFFDYKKEIKNGKVLPITGLCGLEGE